MTPGSNYWRSPPPRREALGKIRRFPAIRLTVLPFIAVFILLLVSTTPGYAQTGPIRQVSQCFASSQGNPYVSMHCAPGGHLSIRSALHGRHGYNTSECGALSDDCVEDQMTSLNYDWQDCMGRSRCFMSVQQSWLPSCGNYSQYLQAEYTCTKAQALKDICKKASYNFREGFLRSPHYPDHYPHSRDCECTVTPVGTDHLFISYLDLSLEMTDGEERAECADWLLMEAGDKEDEAKRSDLNCGEIVQNTKNITVKGTKFRFHFHTDSRDTRSQAFRFNTRRKLKGFWIYIRAEPITNVTMTCGPSKPRKLRKLRPSPTRKPNFGEFYLDSGAKILETCMSIVIANILAVLLFIVVR